MDRIWRLSVIVPTLNNARDLPPFLEALALQDYPKELMEVIVVDGGSTDDTRRIAHQLRAQVIDNPEVLAEPGVNAGIASATGDLAVIMAVDNIFAETSALRTIVRAFDDPLIIAAFPKHDSDGTDTIFTRYINSFTDPFNHFVYGYASNPRTFHHIYPVKRSTDTYRVFDFPANEARPLLALAQGMMLRLPFQRDPSDQFDDCAPVLKLIDRGQDIAYIYDVRLLHHTIRDFRHFVRKQRWATRNAWLGESYGIALRSAELSPRQTLRRRLWPFYALPIIPATLHACIKLAQDREPLWLIHPVMCAASSWASVAELTAIYLRKSGTTTRSHATPTVRYKRKHFNDH